MKFFCDVGYIKYCRAGILVNGKIRPYLVQQLNVVINLYDCNVISSEPNVCYTQQRDILLFLFSHSEPNVCYRLVYLKNDCARGSHGKY